MMIDAAIIDGTDLATNLERLFGNENTDRIHIHNATRGCWAVTAGRAQRRPSGEYVVDLEHDLGAGQEELIA